MRSARRAVAFSLVELVIVIVIIGIIAAIAVPRMSRGSQGAAEGALRADLAILRNAIELYNAEHRKFPASDTGDDGALFERQMTEKTDINGDPDATSDKIYGPYVRQLPPLPVGPNKGATDVSVVADLTPTEAVDVGWLYDPGTGDIVANTDDTDDAGVAYDTY
jgi:general secretion pathway protein G